MSLTKPQFSHPDQLGKDISERKSIFDIEAYVDSSEEVPAPTRKAIDLKTSTPIFHGKEKPENFQSSIFDVERYNTDYNDPGVYSLTYFDEPIPNMERRHTGPDLQHHPLW